MGLFYQYFEWKIPKTQSNKLFPTFNVYQYFNELEISVFLKIFASKDKSISSQDLNLILYNKNLSVVELNRLRRNLLKGLNLKIQSIFGISNGICQVNSFEDKKSRKFMLSENLNLSQLIQMFKVDANPPV